jgi:hypothetical protein
VAAVELAALGASRAAVLGPAAAELGPMQRRPRYAFPEEPYDPRNLDERKSDLGRASCDPPGLENMLWV